MKALLIWAFISLAIAAFAQPDSLHVLWDRSGAGEQSRYGGDIIPLGDQNQDGNADFAVHAWGWGPPGQINEDKIEFFHGGNLPSQQPYMTFILSPDSFYAGMHFTNIGDINGDGFEDWEIWVHYLSDPDSYSVNLYWGGRDADLIPDLRLKIPAGEGDVEPIGDFNGDGYDDIYRYYFPPLDYCEIFYGGNPMDLVPDWTRHSSMGYTYEAFPRSFGDLNGDGYSDFVSGNSQPITFIYLGNVNPDTLPAYTWPGLYSSTMQIIPDLNGDQYDDLLMGFYPHSQIHLGGNSLSSTPTFIMNFVGQCGWNKAVGIGDINGDDFNDFVAIDDGCNNLWGTLGLYLGFRWLNADPAFVVQGRTDPLNMIGIRTAAGLGDVNGDGIDDWAIGAFNADFDGFRGRVVILSGDTSMHVAVDPPRPALPQDFQVTVYPNPFNSSTTIQFSLPVYTRDASLTVCNLLGQQVFETKVVVMSNGLIYRYDASQLSTGLYFLQVTAGSFRTTTKLMVLR